MTEATAPDDQPANLPVPALQPFAEPLPVLVEIGDVRCTADTVYTPSGEAPIESVFWNVTDQTREDSYIPPWAIVLAIIFSLACLVGLLFLLIRNRRIVGWVQVTVQAPNLYHVTNLPGAYGSMAETMRRVDYARGLTQMAKNRRELN